MIVIDETMDLFIRTQNVLISINVVFREVMSRTNREERERAFLRLHLQRTTNQTSDSLLADVMQRATHFREKEIREMVDDSGTRLICTGNREQTNEGMNDEKERDVMHIRFFALQ